MLKIAVVVDGLSVIFEGDKLSAYFDDGSGVLFVNKLSGDEAPYKTEKIAAFAKWDYWHYEKP